MKDIFWADNENNKKAKTAEENSIIEVNSKVEILNINSIVLTVKLINSKN